MSRAFLISVCLTALCFSSAAAAGETKSIPVGDSPESVCRAFGDLLYVTMINKDEPGDGTIVSVDGDKVSVFARGFNAPKGMVYVGGFLIVADETTLWKVNAEGVASKLVEGKDFPKPIEFLNDVAAGLDGRSVYVSEMSTPSPMFDPSGERKLYDLDSPQAKELPRKGRIYRVTLDGRITEAVPPGNEAIRFPNGVAVAGSKDEEQLYVGDFFTGNIVHYTEGQYKILATGLRGVDGLTVTPEAFYASSWTQGKVWKVDRKSGETIVLLEGLKTAADFYFDDAHHQLVVPDMVGGTLHFVSLK